MLVFPQLSTGAPALYPLTKTSRQRTVMNTLADGRTDVYADPAGRSLGWQFEAKGLTAAEWGAIETLFEAASGMWQPFTLLDPAGNLIAESETFGASAWTNGALIALTSGIADPLGTTRATQVVNAGIGVEGVGQTLAVPGNFHYCLSVWARTDSGTSVTLEISTTGGSASKTVAPGTSWTRVSLAANLAKSTESVTFSLQLNAGGTMVIYGMQVEAQLSASDYKPTGTSGGVYSNARFGADTITVTAQGTDVYDASIEIVNMENS